MASGAQESDRPAWLDVDDLEGDHGAGRASRTTWFLAAAAIPWLVVAAMLLRPGHAAAPTAVAAPVAAPTPAPAPAPGDDAGLGAVATEPVAFPTEPGGTTTILSSGALVAVDEDQARTAAVVAARRWLTTVGPGGGDAADASGVAPPGGIYAEHLVVEGVDHPGPGAAVVTVRAIVLRVDGDRYQAVEERRVAVPLRFDAGGAVPAGEPYLLPLGESGAAPFEPTESLDDPDVLLLAGEALAEAGFRDISVRTLHRTASWPLVVTADIAVDDGPARTVSVWLRPHLGRLVVAGTRPPGPAEPAPSDPPPPTDAPS